VKKRIDGATESAEKALGNVSEVADTDRILMSLVMLTMSITHNAIVANLGNPTMRKCLVVFGALVKAHAEGDLQESMLQLLGSASMNRQTVEGYFRDLSQAFDWAVDIIRGPSMGDFVNENARLIAINGCREMMENGHHREAMFWIASMRTICQRVIERDA
jgi:hypothetical protein